MALKTDYKDYEFQQGETLRRYRMIENDDGTISLEDVTQYEVIGDDYSANDANATNVEVNKNAENIETALNNLYRPNLLINGDFQINQRGQESYEVNNNNIYTFDVWRIIASNTTTKVSRLDNGVKFENLGTGDSVFSQRMTIEEVANYTLVIKCSNIVGNVFVEIYYVGANYESHQLTNGINIINITDKNIRDISPTIKQQGSVDIEYIDLFEGDIAYPHVKEDYGIAMTRCQRKLKVYDGALGVAVSTINNGVVICLDVSMDDVPTLSTIKNPTSIAINKLGTVYNSTSIELSGRSTKDVVAIAVITNGFGNGPCGFAYVDSGSLILSCEPV